jgi:WD40 repeat protein
MSYSHHDRPFATRLRAALAAAGKEIWLDEEDILPASRWAQDLKDAIEGADALIAVISPEWAASAECRSELDHAAGLDKRIIPLMLRATPLEQLPAAVRAQQFVPPRGDFEDDFDASLHVLIGAIETDAEWVRAHTRWAKKALEWEEHGHDRSFLLSGSELTSAEQYLASATGMHPEPGQRQGAFVLASRQGATRRQRRLLGGVCVALVIALVLGALALIQRNQAVANQRVAQSRQIAAESETALTSDPELSTLLALQALTTRQTTQAEAALRDALPQLQVLRTLRGSTTMQAATFSPSGAEVITGDLDGNVVLWNASTGRRAHSLRDPQGRSILTVSFNPAGTEFVTTSLDGNDGVATIWSAITERPLRQLIQPASAQVATDSFSPEINDASFSPTGTEVLTAGGDAARIWNVATGQVVGVFQPSGQYSVSSAAFNRDGTQVVTVQGTDAEVWDTSTGRPVLTVSEPGGAGINDAAFSPDGSEIVTASGDGTARTWSTASGQQLQVLTEPGGAVLNAASFSPDGSEVLTAGDDGTAATWDARTGTQLVVLRGHRGPVFAAAFSSDGKEVVTASEDGTAKIWDAQPVGTRQVLADPTGAAFYGGGVDGNGRQVAAVTENGAIDIWNMTSGHMALRLQEPGGGPLNTAAFSPDGKELVTASEQDGDARVWSAETGRQLLVLQEPYGQSLYTAAFSPDGKKIVTASADHTARIWSATTGRQIRVITEPRGVLGEMFSAAFSPDGKEVVTASLDGTTRIATIHLSGAPSGATANLGLR